MKTLICHWIVRLASIFALSLASLTPVAAADVDSAVPVYQLVSTDLPPFTSSDPNASGALSELTAAMMHEIGIKGAIQYFPWARAIYMTTNQPRTLILPLTRTPEREPNYRWVQKLYVQRFVLITRADSGIDLANIKELKKREVVVLRASPNALQLKQLGFQNIIEMATVEDMAKMLARKRVDLLYGGDAICGYFLAKEGLPASGLRMGSALFSGDVWLAGSLDIPQSESRIWLQAMQRIKANGTYEKIMRRYGLPVEN